MSYVLYKNGPRLSAHDVSRMGEAALARLLNGARGEFPWVPAADIQESEDAFLMALDLPGLKREDIEIDVVDNRVTVRGQRKRAETPQEPARYQHLERRSGRFERVFDIPTGFERDKIEAHYEDGVLSLRIPKPEEQKPRRIAVQIK